MGLIQSETFPSNQSNWGGCRYTENKMEGTYLHTSNSGPQNSEASKVRGIFQKVARVQNQHHQDLRLETI